MLSSRLVSLMSVSCVRHLLLSLLSSSLGASRLRSCCLVLVSFPRALEILASRMVGASVAFVLQPSSSSSSSFCAFRANLSCCSMSKWRYIPSVLRIEFRVAEMLTI